MWRLIRSAVAPVLCLFIAMGGISYALVSSADDDPSGDEIALQAETDDDPGENVEEDEGDEEIKAEKTPKPSKAPKASKAPKVRSTEGCPEGFEGNHGQFVSQSADRQAAAKSECGKPVKKDKKAKKDKPAKTEKPEASDEPDDDEDEDEDDEVEGEGE